MWRIAVLPLVAATMALWSAPAASADCAVKSPAALYCDGHPVAGEYCEESTWPSYESYCWTGVRLGVVKVTRACETESSGFEDTSYNASECWTRAAVAGTAVTEYCSSTAYRSDNESHYTDDCERSFAGAITESCESYSDTYFGDPTLGAQDAWCVQHIYMGRARGECTGDSSLTTPLLFLRDQECELQVGQLHPITKPALE